MPGETTPGDGEKTKKKVTMNVNNTTTTAEDGDGGEGHQENGRQTGARGGFYVCLPAAAAVCVAKTNR